MKTTELLKLPRLEIAHKNFASSFVAACNRRFAIYQVDTARRPFWVVELDGLTNKPLRPARRYSEHMSALECLMDMARGPLLGRDLALPVED